MRWMNGAVGIGCFLFGGFLLSLPMAGCDVLGLDGSCSGAEGLRAEHESLLACTGWLDFVQENIRKIEYEAACKLESEHGGEVTGRAHCRSCRVQVTTLERLGKLCYQKESDVEVAAVLVHEAAHLEDDCKHGEAPAEQAEAAFWHDFAAQFPVGISEQDFQFHPCFTP